MLIHEWRAGVKKEAKATYKPQLLLAAAAYYYANGNFTGIPVKYPRASISKNMDWINAMNYDYYVLDQSRGSKKKSDHGLATLGEDLEPERSGSELTWSPSYGYRSSGRRHTVLKFSEIENHNLANKAAVTHDAATVSTYSVAGSTWIGYDDIVI
ncbi:hypothetical protein DCAR_0730238 [Daucus carota subsp. sativus]|uniref:GH18 domain-containing protein n=1 Tax=Daucus carota subsp. sativus TaxID=79200 RepID=A0AAF0XMI0_DAUCS|nr:PREDICTED: uncharacterized protein LOC108195076 [Daucus carota subsp. sativus]WOH10768.1 hypothetical protein DCAR_0730238 [Daucus carota subsp. sativus]